MKETSANLFLRSRMILFFLISGTALLTAFAGYSSDKKELPPKNILRAPSRDMNAVARTAVYLLSNEHFLQQKVDGELSSKLFDEYFKALDPSRIYFTRKDIDRFENRRKLLGSQLRQGNVQFAFDVYNTFLKRLDEYERFTREYLKKNPSLNSTDLYIFERSKLPWEAGEESLRELWKKKIRNDLILFELLDRSRLQEERSGKNKNVKKGRATPKPLPNARERALKRLSRYLKHYRSLENQDILELYLSTLCGIYDPHTSYMSPRSEEDFNINMKLSLVGIGAVLTSEDGYTKVVRVIPGGPAARDKRLKAGDRIIAVAQEHADPVDIMDMPLSKVVTQIRGKENTKVTLTILESAKGSSAVPVNLTLTRGKVPLKDSEVSGKIRKVRSGGKDLHIGVITIPSFYIDFGAAYRGDPDYKSSTRDVIRTFRDLSKKTPLDGLIIDLRSNGGGSLLEAVSLSGLFIPEGPVVQVRSQRRTKVDSDDDNGRILYAGPLALLTNRFSASAAEIFAGAIQDYKRGILLGDSQTHGKGTVQTLIDLGRYTFFLGSGAPSGSIKLTNAKFYRVSGASTQRKGVTPDIVFPSFTDVMEVGEDKLDFALKWDHVPAVRYTPFHREFDPLVRTLREKSRARTDKSPAFRLLRKDIETLRKLRERKHVILNLETRWKEYLAEKKLQEEQKQLLRTSDLSGDTVKDKKDPDSKDIYLQETLCVLSDWIRIKSEKKPVPGQ